MNRIKILLASLGLAAAVGFGTPPVTAQEAATVVAANSAIDQVTIFEDRARVDRVRTVELRAGMNRIEFTGLPTTLDPRSTGVEIGGIGSQRVTSRVLGLKLNPVFSVEERRSAVDHLESKLQEIELALQTLTLRAEEEQKKQSLVDGYAEFLRSALLDRSIQTDPAEIDELMAAEEWVTARTVESKTELGRISKEQSELRLRKSAALQNLARLQAGAERATFTATVQIEAIEPATVNLRLGYDVAEAVWRPVYEARLDETSREVTWSYGGEIYQESGEDWGEVELVLSTQRSSLGLAPPSLVPMQVGGYDADRRSAGLVARKVAESAPSSEESTGGESRDLSVAEIEGAGTVVRFRVPVRASIPSDGRIHRVPILESALAADLAFECIPSLTPHTYRRGKLVNRTDAPFLPGPVRVFRDGAFVGRTEIDMIPAGATYSLSFGVEGRIVVRRIELTDRERTVGTFKKGQRRTLGYRFSIESAMPTAATMVLLDQVPVSEIEGVSVKPTRACAPAPAVDADGICRWPLELTPGSEREVIFEYEVTVEKGVDFPVEQIR